MKEKICLIIILILLLCVLLLCGGCGKFSGKSYENTDITKEQVGGGYFTQVKTWGGIGTKYFCIMYANDTKVLYFVVYDGYSFGITPLYNTDGTLQIYEEE